MTAAISAVALAAPTVIAQALFSMRRFNKGVDNFADNPIYSLGNFDIATGQVVKGTRAASDIEVVGKTLNSAAESIKNTSLASNVAKDVSTVSKAINGIGKGLKTVIDFTAANINLIICITGLAKVIYGDDEDKLKAALQEGLRIATMFGFENTYKKIMGMPKISYQNGKQISTPVEGLFKNNKTVTNTINKFTEKCNTTKLFNKIPLKSLPSGLKGACFVLASITGYKVGDLLAKGANKLLSSKEEA